MIIVAKRMAAQLFVCNIAQFPDVTEGKILRIVRGVDAPQQEL